MRTPVTRSRLITAAVAFSAAAAALFAVAVPAGAVGRPPTGATAVAVHAGAVTSQVNAKLGGGLTLEVLPGTGLDSAAVTIYRNGQPYRTLDTDAGQAGSLVAVFFTGLPTGTYIACAVPLDPNTGQAPSGAGSAAGCYSVDSATQIPVAVPFDGTRIPAAATPIDPAKTSQIVVPLLQGAEISGKVTDSSGTAVTHTGVIAVNRLTGQRFTTSTASDGTYRIRHLSGSSTRTTNYGYKVCFDPHAVFVATNLAPRCFHNVSWNGGGSGLPAATKVLTVPTQASSGINQALLAGGAIAGTVADASTGEPLITRVAVFSGGGGVIQQVASLSNGSFRIVGLSPSTRYQVCATAEGYISQCWKNVSWTTSALPSGTTPVAVRAGAVTGGLTFTLATQPSAPFGTISGRVVQAPGGTPLDGATVSVFDSTGTLRKTTTTDSTGAYTVQLKPSSTGYRICASAWDVALTPTGPPTGWAPRCFGNVSWLGSGAPTATVKAITLAAGATVSRVGIGLPAGGAISGSGAKTLGTGGDTSPVTVHAFTASGKPVTSVPAQTDGTYRLLGLSTGRYIVCFDGTHSGALSKCFKNVSWDPGG